MKTSTRLAKGLAVPFLVLLRLTDPREHAVLQKSVHATQADIPWQQMAHDLPSDSSHPYAPSSGIYSGVPFLGIGGATGNGIMTVEVLDSFTSHGLAAIKDAQSNSLEDGQRSSSGLN